MFRLKTPIGSLFSMHRVIAVVSMTRRPRFKRVDVGDVRQPHRGRIDQRIGRVDAVHLRRLEDDLGAYLDGPQAAAVSVVKNGIAGPRGEDDDPRPSRGGGSRAGGCTAPATCRHIDRGHGTGSISPARSRRPWSASRVDHRRQHAHVVGGRSVHAGGRARGDPGRCSRRRSRWRSRRRGLWIVRISWASRPGLSGSMP